MSNNGDVDYDGDSYFFTTEDARMVADIEADPHVALNFAGAKGILGKPPTFITVEGRAELSRDKADFADHWQEKLERWFPDGIETPSMVMIKVRAHRIHYWDGLDSGEVLLEANDAPSRQLDASSAGTVDDETAARSW
jgi:general stress protein 26